MGLKDVWNKTGGALWNKAKDKYSDWRENSECKKKLELAFKSDENFVSFKVHFLNGKVCNFDGLLFKNENIIQMDSDLKKSEVLKIVDGKGNEYFIEYINPKKVKFYTNIQLAENESITMEKELDEIHYTNIKPKEDKPPVYNTYNITKDDHSTNYKGIKNSNIGSKDSSVDIKKETNVDVSANLHHKKGE